MEQILLNMAAVEAYHLERDARFFNPVNALDMDTPISVDQAKALAAELQYCYGVESRVFPMVSWELIDHGNKFFDALRHADIGGGQMKEWMKPNRKKTYNRVMNTIQFLTQSSDK